MVRMDLVASLKNALDRGYSIDQAKQSLINSGYGTGEIETAAKYLTGGIGITPQTMEQATQEKQPNNSPQTEQQQIKQAVNPHETKQLPQTKEQKPKKKFTWTMFFLVLMFVILLGGLALVFLFKDAIVDFFQSI